MPHDFETPQILHDAPLRHDDAHHFHFDEFAMTLCRLIADKNTRTPLTIGISGSWGSGKTTLLQHVKQKLDEAGDLSDATQCTYWGKNENPKTLFRSCKTVWFDAWKYADEDKLLVALIRVILATMAQGNLGDKFWGKVLDKTAPRYNVIATLLSFFKFKIGTDFEVSFDLEKYKEETPFAKSTAFFDYFDEALEELIARWVHDTGNYRKIDEKQGALVILVDDLDRCLPEKTVQVLEAIKLFLDKHGCVFVLGADLNVVRSAVEMHYQNTKITGEMASDYLEKIIQLRFELPPIVDQQMNDYLQAETKAALDEETRKNWRLVMIGAEINPRKVKTFFNDLNLRWTMLKNSEQAKGVNRDDFTCWQVLMRAAPYSFVSVANKSEEVPRHTFILEAQKWARGDQSLDEIYERFEIPQHVRRLLREIEFSPQFNSTTLDAFVHLTTPPQPPPSFASEGRPQTRDEVEVPEVNVQVWGGVEFTRIPAGKFLMGSHDGDNLSDEHERPQHSVDIPYDYWMAKSPVTNAQFACFVEATKYVTTAEKEGGWSTKESKLVKGVDWRHPLDPESIPKYQGSCPVVQVSWLDALEYCKWLNSVIASDIQVMQAQVRLPSEAEWEKAARGKYRSEWPWGNEFDKTACNSSEGNKRSSTPVGVYSPRGDSPYGVADMAGNVWEWCHSLFRPYPYDPNDGRESETELGARVMRGGSFYNAQRLARCAFRNLTYPNERYRILGFRIVVAPALS